MKIPPNAVMWRDPVDIGLFWVGFTSEGETTGCFSLALGDIEICFGWITCRRAAQLEPGEPVPLASVLEGDAPENDTEKRLDVGGTV